MPDFLISAGNSDSGPVGYVARVEAATKELALDRLKEQLPGQDTIRLDGGDIVDLQIYFNVDELTLENVIESETEDDDDDDDDDTEDA